MLFEWIVQRVAVGAAVIFGTLAVAWLAKYLLLPLVIAVLAVGLSFMVGDWVIYVLQNEAGLIYKIKKVFNP
jgi:hypothetical protein